MQTKIGLMYKNAAVKAGLFPVAYYLVYLHFTAKKM